MIRAFLLCSALLAFTLPALAQQPALKIETANITRVDGTRVELGLGLFRADARAQHPIEVWFVEGGQRHKLWENQGTFAPTQGGFRTAVTVDLRGRNLRKGKLEVIAPACQGATCKQTLPLGGGANLKFDGPPEVERRGADSLMTLKVTNSGSAASTPCKFQVEIDGRRAHSTALPAVAPGTDRAMTFRYTGAQRNKPYEAKLVCRDMVRFDNDKGGRLP